MAATYSGDPSSSNRDAVRFLVRDTTVASALVQDEEIDWTLTEEPNVYFAAARIADQIASKFAQIESKSVGDLKISSGQRYLEFRELRKSLERRGATRSANPYAGGISKSDKETVEDDDDRTRPAFTRKQFDNPNSRTDDRDPGWES